MAKTNVKSSFIEKTHEGAPAIRIDAEKMLRRSLMSCLLWESTFYEDGQDIADRLLSLTHAVSPEKAASLAIEARNKQMLRHAPLWIVRALICHPDRHKDPSIIANTIYQVIQRPDELCELLSLYWKDGKSPLPNQVKKGLAMAFTKFSEYQLAKWNRPSSIKLRDVLFLCHAKPLHREMENVWKRLVDNDLATPDTWEVSLSGGADKKETFMRLLKEEKLPSFAFISNLRNMYESGVDKSFVKRYLNSYNFDKVLPYRFIAAAMAVPDWEDIIEEPMLKKLENSEKLKGKTLLLVDVSGSMKGALNLKSTMTRLSAAESLAILVREICEDSSIYSFSNNAVQIPNRRGFSLADAIDKSQPHSSTCLQKSLIQLKSIIDRYDRLIIVTDEQVDQSVEWPDKKIYILNVATYKNGVGYGKNIVHIDGWSDNSVKYIKDYENG